MPRYRQTWSEEEQDYVLIKMGGPTAPLGNDGNLHIRRDIDPFVSPVDGSTIRTQRDLDNHNKRNNVVSSSEFSPAFYERKAKERARLYSGEHTPAEKQARGEEIHRIIERLERR